MSPRLESFPKVITTNYIRYDEGLCLRGVSPKFSEINSSLSQLLINNLLKESADIIKNCEGSFWGWQETGNHLYVFTDHLGSFPVYIGLNKENQEIIFDHFGNVLSEFYLRTDQNRIATYLSFGYIPGNHTLFLDINCIHPGSIICFSKDEDIKSVSYFDFPPKYRIQNNFVESVNELSYRLDQNLQHSFLPNQELTIPISGGLDSRAILASTSKFNLDKNKLNTFTFGYPGSLDFELGYQVAHHYNTNHISYPLSIKNYGLRQLKDAILECGGQIFVIPDVPLDIMIKESERNDTLISGFTGDLLAGSHIIPKLHDENNRKNWKSIVLAHNLFNNIDNVLQCFKQFDLTKVQYIDYLYNQYFSDSIYNDCIDGVGVSDTWDYYNRQRKYILFSISKLRNRINYIFPFLNGNIFNFARLLPTEYRINKIAYRSALLKAFSGFHSVPVSEDYGASLQGKKINKYQKILNLSNFWLQNRLVKGNFDPYIAINYLPFWEYYSSNWEIINYVKGFSKYYDFINFNILDDDLNSINKKRLYAYRRGHEYFRITSFINLILTLNTLSVDIR
jgi:hypothetical protein